MLIDDYVGQITSMVLMDRVYALFSRDVGTIGWACGKMGSA